jgi:predicted CxxxxCH...CXXCH cytochrome family protein
MAPAASTFHGKALAAKQFDASECRQCHGSLFDGGISQVSCKTCHVSYPHPENFAGAHSNFVKSIAYNITSCQSCHGQNYGTQKINNSCLTCHTKQGGPEACNTCHGDFAGDATDLTKSAPPKGLDDETSPATPAVGAHQAHFVYFDKLTAATVCQECHALPQNFAAAGHLDADARAELPFNGPLATVKTEGGTRVPNVSYNAANNTCAGSYCHGNWGLIKSQSRNDFIFTADKMEGLNASPKWTDATTATCGSCHGLPPAGHQPYDYDITLCNVCHPAVIDINGKIIDQTKHVNGKVNVFNQEYPMF